MNRSHVEKLDTFKELYVYSSSVHTIEIPHRIKTFIVKDSEIDFIDHLDVLSWSYIQIHNSRIGNLDSFTITSPTNITNTVIEYINIKGLHIDRNYDHYIKNCSLNILLDGIKLSFGTTTIEDTTIEQINTNGIFVDVNAKLILKNVLIKIIVDEAFTIPYYSNVELINVTAETENKTIIHLNNNEYSPFIKSNESLELPTDIVEIKNTTKFCYIKKLSLVENYLNCSFGESKKVNILLIF